jgi:DNA-binding transcriptional MerR regulator
MSNFDFPVVVDNAETIPENFKNLYEEKEGKLTLVESLRKKVDTTSLVNALDAERRISAENKKLSRDYKALGKSPEEIKELLEAREAEEEEKRLKAGEFDTIKNQMVDKHKKELEEKEKQVLRMQSTVEKKLIEAEAVKEIAAAEGSPELLLLHVKTMTKVVEENGEYQVRVVNSKGDPRVNAQGDFLTIKDLVAELKQSDVFGQAFKGSGKSGSGMPPGSNGGGSAQNGVLARSKMTVKEKSAYITEHGQVKYNQLPY